ncbi:MAG: hypothetical protein JWN67_2312 [Actinomycetia bacterium]|nr:hypothetical protein [Actinomycetes bacterium]
MIRVPAAALDLQLVAAGVGVHLAFTRLGSWFRRRHDAWPAWFGVSSAAMAVVLIGNVVVLRHPTEAALLVRTVALSVVLVCMLGSISAFTGQRLPRVVGPLFLVLVVGRIALWVTTDLVYAHQVVDGLPRYGPLVGVTAVPALLLLLTQATLLASRVAQPFERTALLAGTGLGLVTATATLVVGDPVVAELLTGCWTIPQLVVLQLVLVHRRTAEIDRQLRFHREQAAIARLGELALGEREVEHLLAHVVETVESVLATSCVVALDGDADHVGPGWAHPVVGHRGRIGQVVVGGPEHGHDRPFVETIAQLLGAWVDRASAERDAERRALHDELTGLPNRALLRARLEEALELDAGTAVVFLDLDGFKDLNDALGHAVGDLVLVEMADRLVAAAGGSGTVCRFGGDEFVVVCGSTDEQGATEVARALQVALNRPLACAGTSITMTACAGVVVAGDGDTADSLLRDADTAMYCAKDRAAGSVAVFSPAVREQLLHRLETERALGRAAELGEIEVHYQPVIDLHTLDLVGVEALARWRRDGELIAPLEWVPLAEATGAIVDIGRSVLRTACRDALLLPTHVGVAVNVSARQLSASFACVVDEALRCGLAPGRLTLEITESALVEDPVVVTDLLANLRRRGVQIAIDDFGTGFSSLGQVASLPIDILKIDRCFVERLTSVDGYAIAATIVTLAEALHLDVVAEGVETTEQLELLRQLGCGAAQGYLFARPGPLADRLRSCA